MDTIRRLEWKSIFSPVHNYIFRYRKAGGDDNASLHAENSRAVVDTVYGNTVKWNQLVQNGDFKTTSGWSTVKGSLSIVNGKCLFTFSSNGEMQVYKNIPVVSGHKYYYCRIFRNGLSGGITLLTASSNSLEFNFRGYIGATGDVVEMNYGMLIDLTLLGIGNLTTVAEVESWLATNVGAQDYYPYDAGSLISFVGTSLKSVGFNQWDEEWEVGAIDSSTGANVANSQVMRSKNYIPCFPSTKYYFKGPTFNFGGIRFYGLGMKYIGSISSSTASNSEFETLSNCRFIRFQSTTIYGPSYNNDICINLSDASRNGTYAPYWEDSVDLSFAQNIPDPSNPSQSLFPYGLCSAGSVHDEVSATTAIKRVGTVDLGSVTIYQSAAGTSNYYFNIARAVGPNAVNGICARYAVGNTTKNGDTIDSATDKTIYYLYDASHPLWRDVYIKDSSYINNASGLKNSLNGVMLYYELATPITVSLSAEQRMIYKVDKYSTEEVLFPSSQTGTPTSTPLNADIDYQYRG